MKAIIKHHFDAWGYQAFKYLVYLLLAYNLVLFYQEESLASEVTFSAGFSLTNIVEAFSATVDTAAWVLLLLLFELETYTIDDDKLTGWIKRAMHGLRVFCYFFIVYALYGYILKLGLTFNFNAIQLTDLCALNGDWKYMETLNEYVPLSKQNCVEYGLNSGGYLTHQSFNVISSDTDLFMTQALAWVDVINATAWLMVVLMLEYDVRVQLGKYSSVFWEQYSRVVKGSVYSILFVASVYWGLEGNFVDFWDSFLWLVAFFLIELNIFEWQEEVNENKQTIAMDLYRVD